MTVQRAFLDLTLTRRLPGLRGGIPRVERMLARSLPAGANVGFVALDRFSSHFEVLPDDFVARLIGAPPLAGEGEPEARLAPGDLVVLLGMPYETHGAELLGRLAARHGIGYVPLINDIAPLREPGWFPPATELEGSRFSQTLRTLAELSPLVLVPSLATRAELRSALERWGIDVPRIEIVELGHDFPARTQPPVVPPVAPGTFALAVGTLQPRKNHRLIVDLWRSERRLCFADGCGLVIAGGSGWGTTDLLRILEAETRRRDRIIHLDDCDDDMLAWLYRNCRFTLFPSWSEGYGLPVAESLRHHKVCLASTDPAVVEAGRGLAVHLDPADPDAWRRAVLGLVENPAELRDREAVLARHQRSVSWQACARRLLELVGAARTGPRQSFEPQSPRQPTTRRAVAAIEHPLWRGGSLHPLFDPDWYDETNPDVAVSGLDPLFHFVHHGWRESRSPHPLFHTGFYFRENPDVARIEIDPLKHYLECGARERRRTHWLFDPDHYCRMLGEEPEDPLTHFLTSPFRADPHPLFDVRWYLAANPDVRESGLNPLVHYVRFGWKERRSAHPLFDPDYYLRHAPDVAAAGIDPLGHYLDSGAREGRRVHPLFDAPYYCRQLAVDPPNPLVHYVTSSSGADPHPLFDTAYYSTRYPEAVRFARAALADYVADGVRAGRSPHPLFDPRYYREQVPDLSHDADPLAHYLEFGWPQFEPHPLFRGRAYRLRYPDADVGRAPLEHFVTAGAAQGLEALPGVDALRRLNERDPLAPSELDPFDLCAAPPRPPRRRVLVVDCDVPDPDRDGGSWCLVNEIRVFRSFGFAVTLATPELDSRGGAARALEAEGVTVATAERWGSFADLVIGLDDLAFVYACRFESGEAVYPLLRRHRPDTRLIVSLVDLHHLRERREAAVLGAAGHLHPERTRARELALVSVADAAVVPGAFEVQELRRALPAARVLRLPLAAAAAAAPPPLDGRRGAMVLGSFLHRPNADAVLWFLREVWPLVRAEAPRAEVTVCGSGMRADLFGSLAPGVTIAGPVADLEDLFGRARVHVAPLRFGAGIKTKVARALAAGLPNVLTSVAAEGIALEAGADAFVADDAGSLALAVARLLEDDGLWQAMSKRSVAVARREFDPPATKRALADALAAAGIEVPAA